MNNNNWHKLVVAIVLLAAPGAYTGAGDVEAGKAKAAVCGACHGAAGISNNPEWPHLAGQQETYLKNQLMNFRSGSRKNPLMSPMAAPLSDTDIENLAAYFASLKQN